MNKKFLLSLAVLVTLVGAALGVYLLMRPSDEQFTPNQSVTVRGKIVCLPHKNQDGPHTLECATGLYSDVGKYYGLKNLPPNYSVTTQAVEVIGTFQEPPADTNYSISGTIDVTEVRNY